MDNCHYCKRKKALNKENWYEHQLYYVEKKYLLGTGYTYKTQKVNVPRCHTCTLHHSQSSLINFWVFSIVFITGIFFLLHVIKSDLITSIILSLIAGGIITFVFSLIHDHYKFKALNSLPQIDIDDFPPVKVLLKEGWTLEKPGKDPHTAKETKEIWKDEY